MFYLTLPSNSSMDYYPDNTLTTYTTKLAQPLELEGSWEVGLAEIQYPRSWYNIYEEDVYVTVRKHPEKIAILLRVKPGYYPNIKKLLKVLDKIINVYGDGTSFRFTHDEITQKVKVVVKTNFEINMSPSLQTILGFTKGKFVAGTHFGEHVVDLHRGFYSLYVYCPLLEPRMVGDTVVPLLREIAIEGQTDQVVVTKTYQKIHYVPLQQKRFETIKIYIRDDTSNPVPFQWGKVVVTLSFRRRGLKYL